MKTREEQFGQCVDRRLGVGATRCVGENMATSCGNFVSIALRRMRSLSYSASEISGASFS